MKPEQLEICAEALAKKGLLDISAIRFLGRARFAKDGLVMGRPTKFPDADKWDWSKSDVELSREQGISITTARNVRCRLGHPAVAAPREPGRLLEERRQWDWSKSDTELAREHQITRERSCQIRAELGLPPRSEGGGRREREFMVWLNGRKIINNLEAQRAGFLPDQVRKYCEKHGIEREIFFESRQKHPWEKFNWALPNWTLAEVWNVPLSAVAAYRSRNGLQKCPHVLKIHRGSIQLLIDAEKQKQKI